MTIVRTREYHIKMRLCRILHRCETDGLHAILPTKDDRYWCWGILSQGGDGAKTQRQANTHRQVHGCCHKKRFPQRFLWNTHGPDALLPAKRVWILESPLAHLAVAAHRPVAERKDKIDFSLHRHVLCTTFCLSKLVWEVRGCHIVVYRELSTPLAWWWWWWWWADQSAQFSIRSVMNLHTGTLNCRK